MTNGSRNPEEQTTSQIWFIHSGITGIEKRHSNHHKPEMMVRGLHSGSSLLARSMFSSPLCKCGIKLLFALLTLALGFLTLLFSYVSSAWSCEFVQVLRLRPHATQVDIRSLSSSLFIILFLNTWLTACSISISICMVKKTLLNIIFLRSHIYMAKGYNSNLSW